MNPGRAELQRRMAARATSLAVRGTSSCKATGGLFERIADRDALAHAFNRVRANGGAAGVTDYGIEPVGARADTTG